MANPRAGRRWVHRILLRLEAMERRCCWSGTQQEAQAYRLAALTIDRAFYHNSENPFADACRIVFGRSTPPPTPAWVLDFQTSAAHLEQPTYLLPTDIDGRSPQQWVQAILDYLAYRSGRNYRSLRDRFSEHAIAYDQASKLVKQQFWNAPATPPIPYRPARAIPTTDIKATQIRA